MTDRVVRLGTRRSALATAQSGMVARQIEAASGGTVTVQLVEITTTGDVSRASLASMGGVGVFVSQLRERLLSGEIDLAVHSMKDLPTGPAEGLTVAAVPGREDPRDVLVARDGMTLTELPPGARIGTGSPRRAAQLRALGFGLDIHDIRGNVDTRLRLVAEGRLDGVILARAGLVRLGREGEATEVLDPLLMLPAPGQGALAVECREADDAVRQALAPLDDPGARAAVTAERVLLATLEAGCAAPLGALAEVAEGEDGPELSLRAVVASLDGTVCLRRSASRPLPADPGSAVVTARDLGRELAAELLHEGAADLVEAAVPAEAGALLAGVAAPTTRQAGEGDL